MRTNCILFILIIINKLIISQDYIEPSQNPPGNLSPKEVPMFVSFGFDDNYYSGLDGSGGKGGMKWILDFVRDLKNPDGSNVRCTFFNCPHPPSNEKNKKKNAVLVKKAWQIAYIDGHELGNHTYSHPHGGAFTRDEWRKEILKNESLILKPFDSTEILSKPDTTIGIGLSKEEYYGFRTPYLEHSIPLFAELKKQGYLYDCSIEEGIQPDQDGSNNFWPYTLDNGSPGYEQYTIENNKESFIPVTGLWEMPVYVFIIPPDNKCKKYGTKKGLRKKAAKALNNVNEKDGKITGFDYNLMAHPNAAGANLNKKEILATLKYSFELRYYGNRSPMLIGAHTTYYSTYWKEAPSIPNVKDRQWIIEEFIKYLQTFPEVRIVPYIEVIRWMRNPIKLEG